MVVLHLYNFFYLFKTYFSKQIRRTAWSKTLETLKVPPSLLNLLWLRHKRQHHQHRGKWCQSRVIIKLYWKEQVIIFFFILHFSPAVTKGDTTEPAAVQGNVSISTEPDSKTTPEHGPDTCSKSVPAEKPSSTSEQEQVGLISKCNDLIPSHLCFSWFYLPGWRFTKLFLYSYSKQGPKKLSYAEVCQRPARDPPLAEMPTPSTPTTSPNTPLKELKVNTVKEPQLNSKNSPERVGDKPPRQPSRTFRGAPGHARPKGSAMKIREHQRGLNAGKRFSPHRGPKHSGKEQNIPPLQQNH